MAARSSVSRVPLPPTRPQPQCSHRCDHDNNRPSLSCSAPETASLCPRSSATGAPSADHSRNVRSSDHDNNRPSLSCSAPQTDFSCPRSSVTGVPSADHSRNVLSKDHDNNRPSLSCSAAETDSRARVVFALMGSRRALIFDRLERVE